MKTIKSLALIAVYIILIISEIFMYVPYEEITIYVSRQNVPHTEITGNGYSSMKEIENFETIKNKKENSTTERRVDNAQLRNNIAVTTIIALLLYFLFFFKKSNEKEQVSLFDFSEEKKQSSKLKMKIIITVIVIVGISFFVVSMYISYLKGWKIGYKSGNDKGIITGTEIGIA